LQRRPERELRVEVVGFGGVEVEPGDGVGRKKSVVTGGAEARGSTRVRRRDRRTLHLSEYRRCRCVGDAVEASVAVLALRCLAEEEQSHVRKALPLHGEEERRERENRAAADGEEEDGRR
jgi:hypothetical protein